MTAPRDPHTAAPRRRALLTVWLLAAMGLGMLLLIASLAEGPLDDPDQAYQRPGLLDLHPLPTAAAPVTATVPQPGRPAVVFFTRPERFGPLCAALPGAEVDADMVIVVAGSGAAPECGPLPVVADPSGRLATVYRLRTPADGGPPVGYAVVDEAGRIRYSTLDPAVAEELAEVRTIVEAL
ncbi:MAG: hypothetical protein ACRDST_15820 [Pseudonocardiaceae bacterium]